MVQKKLRNSGKDLRAPKKRSVGDLALEVIPSLVRRLYHILIFMGSLPLILSAAVSLAEPLGSAVKVAAFFLALGLLREACCRMSRKKAGGFSWFGVALFAAVIEPAAAGALLPFAPAWVPLLEAARRYMSAWASILESEAQVARAAGSVSIGWPASLLGWLAVTALASAAAGKAIVAAAWRASRGRPGREESMRALEKASKRLPRLGEFAKWLMGHGYGAEEVEKMLLVQWDSKVNTGRREVTIEGLLALMAWFAVERRLKMTPVVIAKGNCVCAFDMKSRTVLVALRYPTNSVSPSYTEFILKYMDGQVKEGEKAMSVGALLGEWCP